MRAEKSPSLHVLLKPVAERLGVVCTAVGRRVSGPDASGNAHDPTWTALILGMLLLIQMLPSVVLQTLSRTFRSCTET